MDTRITPFGNHPDGGKISEFSSEEKMPDYMLELSQEVVKILENVPQKDRVDYVLHSIEPELWEAREALKNKLYERFLNESLRKAEGKL